MTVQARRGNMSAYETRKALEQSVLNAWDRRFSKPSQNEVDRAMAATAVADVVDALRYNPAWLRSLGLVAEVSNS